jgi:hypothetical protein
VDELACYADPKKPLGSPYVLDRRKSVAGHDQSARNINESDWRNHGEKEI